MYAKSGCASQRAIRIETFVIFRLFRARTFFGVRLNILCKLVLYKNLFHRDLFLLPLVKIILHFSGIVIAFKISQRFP